MIGCHVVLTGNPYMQSVYVSNLDTIDGSLSLQIETITRTATEFAELVDLSALQTVGGNINLTGPVKALGLGSSDADITYIMTKLVTCLLLFFLCVWGLS